MTEALALAAALLTAEADISVSDAQRCWNEVSRFGLPPSELGKAHAEWLEARKELDRDICPWIDEVIAEQSRVLRAYNLVEIVLARPYAPSDWGRLEELRALIGDDDYFAGRLPLPVTCQRHRP